MQSSLKEKFNKEVISKFKEKFSISNAMAVPKITKVILNSGIGKFLKEKEAIDEIVAAIRDITGQKPVLAKAKKSISGFKVRQGQEIGVAVALRGRRMWDFLDRLVYSTFPRVRDFQGISEKCFDSQGNLNVAVKEHIVFPEIAAENVKNVFGLQVTVVSTAKTKEEGIELLRLLGFPIKLHNT
jgi:large subunit ribosomal protein L5